MGAAKRDRRRDCGMSQKNLIDFVRREIRHAGFLAVTAANTPQATSTVRLPIVQWAGAVSTTDYGCGAGFVTNLAQPIWGANDANGLSACIPSASYAHGDVLVIRRAGLTAIPSTTALASNTLYVRSEFIGATVFLGPTLTIRLVRHRKPLPPRLHRRPHRRRFQPPLGPWRAPGGLPA